MDVETIQLGAGLTMQRVVVGDLANNVYLLDDGEGHALLVDAAAEAGVLRRLVEGHHVESLVTTHRHHDHIGALADLVAATGARPVCGEPDVRSIQESTGVACDPVWTGDDVVLGQHRIDVIGLVGHTPGSITLVVRPQDGPVHLLTGDSLFPGGLGKTGSAQDFKSLFHDVMANIFDVFGDDTVVHPGHGERTTLGAERPHLAEWHDRGW